jgi:hypothetical protein
MIDYIKNFGKYEKEITRYILERLNSYKDSSCRKNLFERISRLNSSWDLEVAGARKSSSRYQSQPNFMNQLTYGLVKEQILTRRSIFTSNFRGDPIFSFRAIGNTPEENAINMQDLVESNNEQIRMRSRILIPSIDMMCKWGAAVVYTEYMNNQDKAWRTIADPMFGSKRVYGVVSNTKNAQCYLIDIRNYFQNENYVSCDDSDIRGHVERWTLAKLINRIESDPELYIKENVEKVVKRVKDEHNFLKNDLYIDPQGKQSSNDYNKIAINDIARGQVQLFLEGNEDDSTYYYFELVGDKIIRFQDNPYDMNMNQYTIVMCEPRFDYWWGNTPSEYSIQTENAVNLLNGLSLDNAIEGMKRYIFYNKNAINPTIFQHVAHNAKIPVDVGKDVALNNILYQYQPQETALPAIQNAYRMLLENNQRMTTTPDLNRAPSAGGPSNKTAYAADIMASVGNTKDADLLDQFSSQWCKIGEKEAIVLAQFLGNFGPILIRPPQTESIREVQKYQITGNWSVYIDTAIRKTDDSEITRYQNIVTWLLNLASGGAQLPINYEPLVRQILKMGKFFHTDEILQKQEALTQQPGYMPTQTMPGQEMAGAGQEVMQPQMAESVV